MVFHCLLNLRFPDDPYCAASFHVLVCRLCIFGEVSVQVFGPCFSCLAYFLTVEFSSIFSFFFFFPSWREGAIASYFSALWGMDRPLW